MGNDTQKIKLLALWDILNKHTDEDHPMHTDEIITALREKGISASRKVLPQDIDTLNAYGYEVLSFKKKFHYYYVVNRPFDAAEVVMIADSINASKLSATQKKALVGRLADTLCLHQAESVSKHIVSLDKGRKGSCSLIYNVDTIERAIDENKKISFLYFDYDEKHKKVYRKNGKRYIVSPAYMVWNKDNYYLLCFSNGHNDLVYVQIESELQTSENIIAEAVTFMENDTATLTSSPTLVAEGVTDGPQKITLSWEKAKGVLLNIAEDKVYDGGKYVAKLKWTTEFD